MIKLSDYLDYLNSEIIQARKKADENAIRIAKEYAEHPYLKYFKVPRYSMPSVKMDIPVKISDIDADSKYSFKVDKAELLTEINSKIKLINTSKKLDLPLITDKQLENEGFKNLFKTLDSINTKEDLQVKGDSSTKTDVTAIIAKPDIIKAVKSLNIGVFRPQDSTEEEKNIAMQNILSEAVSSRIHIVSSKLNGIYIDPDTSKNEDKDKIFLNLHVEMEEEGIRLVRLQNADNTTVEEITFE